MANLLYLAHRFPYPPNKGDKVRSYHLLKHLATKHRVFLGTFIDDPADEVHVETVAALCAGLHVARLRPRVARAASLRALSSGESMTTRYYRDRGLQDWVEATCQSERIDAADDLPAVGRRASLGDDDDRVRAAAAMARPDRVGHILEVRLEESARLRPESVRVAPRKVAAAKARPALLSGSRNRKAPMPLATKTWRASEATATAGPVSRSVSVRSSKSPASDSVTWMA